MMNVRSLLNRLRRDKKGLALIEFAMVTPPMLVLTMYGLEAANLAIVRLRIEQIASSTADGAARVRDTIDETNIDEIFQGAKSIGSNIKFVEKGRIILSSVELNTPQTGQYIRWQRCIGQKAVPSSYGVQGQGATDASLLGVGPTGRKAVATDGIPLMFVEVQYDYQPIVSNSLYGNITFSQIRAFPVRQRNDQVLKNVKPIVARTCNLFTT